MTHQRHFLPHCDRILVLKDGHQRALGTYSQLAPSALTELAQLQEETELDDAVYDDQIPASDGQPRQAQTALQGTQAGPIQATVNIEVPAAAAAASQEAAAADDLTHAQHNDGILASSVPPDSLATLATAAPAATAVAQTTSNSTTAVQQPASLLPAAAEATAAGQGRRAQGQGHQQPTAFCPAELTPKRVVLPPQVDRRWGPVKLWERWWDRLRGHAKSKKGIDADAELEPEAPEKEQAQKQAQLNQQEARATGKNFAHCCKIFVNLE